MIRFPAKLTVLVLAAAAVAAFAASCGRFLGPSAAGIIEKALVGDNEFLKHTYL